MMLRIIRGCITMKALVIYESYFGNTEQIAQAIGRALDAEQPVEVLATAQMTPDKLRGLDLLIVGSPTRGFRPSEGMLAWLQDLGQHDLDGVRVAAFDTRIALGTIESAPLRFIVKTGGFAAKRIAKSLSGKGGVIAAEPEGFTVDGEKGPLSAGELERAGEWAKQVATA